MADVCPFSLVTFWVFCNEGKPSHDPDGGSKHTCKAWGVVKYTVSGPLEIKPIEKQSKLDKKPVYGCRLIERQ